jgi:hypothetical protein
MFFNRSPTFCKREAQSCGEDGDGATGEALWASELVDLLLIKIFMRLNQQSIPYLDVNPNYDQKHHERRDSYNMEAKLLKPPEEGVTKKVN